MSGQRKVHTERLNLTPTGTKQIMYENSDGSTISQTGVGGGAGEGKRQPPSWVRQPIIGPNCFLKTASKRKKLEQKGASVPDIPLDPLTLNK